MEKIKFCFGFEVSNYGMRVCAEQKIGKMNREQRFCDKKGLVYVKLLRKNTVPFLEHASRRLIPI